MGSACCVAAREKTVPHGDNIGSPLYAYPPNAICSPSWSWQLDNRSHVRSSSYSSLQFYPHALSNATNTIGESKRDFVEGTLSNGESQIQSFKAPTWPKSPVSVDAVDDFAFGRLETNSNPPASTKTCSEVKDFTTRLSAEGKLETNVVASGFSPLKLRNDLSSSCDTAVFPTLTSLRKARRSPGHPLSRQISDACILALKSSESSTSEDRPSFVFSVGNNDITMGSHGSSSDGWSMRTFSELVASSRRDRWSFDGENLTSNCGKITGSCSVRLSSFMDFQCCGLFLKSLVDRSPWISGKDVPIVAVLVCGHVYHTDCLDSMTPDAEKFDPRCPACMSARKLPSKTSPGKALRVDLDSRGRHKISRIAVADDTEQQVWHSGPIKGPKRDVKGPKTPSSSSKGGSFAKPFLKRHFSLGSRPARHLSVNDSAGSKGFLARYSKE